MRSTRVLQINLLRRVPSHRNVGFHLNSSGLRFSAESYKSYPWPVPNIPRIQAVESIKGLLASLQFYRKNDIPHGFGDLFKRGSAKQDKQEIGGNIDGENTFFKPKSNSGNEPPKLYPEKYNPSLFFYMVAAAILLLLTFWSSRSVVITWKEFENEILSKGFVEKISVSDNQVTVYICPGAESSINLPVRSSVYKFGIGSVDSFERKLERAQLDLGIPNNEHVPVMYQGQVVWYSILSSIIPTLIYVGVFYYLLNKVSAGSSASRGMFNISNSRAKLFKKTSNTGVKFRDVAGMEEVKAEMAEFVNFLQMPEKYEKLGASLPRGAILSGPPGTGKTMLAKAIAGEANLPFFFVSGSEFIEMFVGVGASRVRDLFENARKSAPCIIFIDEIDAIGKSRGRGSVSPGGSDERESTLNQLLVEMDGFSPRDHIVVIAGTNRPDVLDPALLRSGRFDRHINIDLPALNGRKEIFDVYMKPLKTDVDKTEICSLLSYLTPGFSGADIKNVCNEAALFAAREDCLEIQRKHFLQAVDRIVAGVEKKSMVLSPEERKIVAFHEAGHAVAGWFLKHAQPLLKISVIPRASGALGFTHFLSEEKYLKNPIELLDSMCMLLGGRASEKIFFNTVTTGASDDIKKVTNLAYAQVKTYGMSDSIGNICYGDNPNDNVLYKTYSEETSRLIDNEVKSIVNHAYERTLNLIRSKTDLVEKIAMKLLEKEVLDRDDIVSILGPRSWAENGISEPIAHENKTAPEVKESLPDPTLG